MRLGADQSGSMVNRVNFAGNFVADLPIQVSLCPVVAQVHEPKLGKSRGVVEFREPGVTVPGVSLPGLGWAIA